MQFTVRGDPIEPLDDVQATEIGLDAHVSVDCLSHRPKAFEVLGIRSNHDVHVLGSANHAPSSKRKAADYDEFHFRLRQAAEDLIELIGR